MFVFRSWQIIVGLSQWRAALPLAVEAVFVTPACSADARTHATAWHRAFVRAYYHGGTLSTPPPLVEFVPPRGDGGAAFFREFDPPAPPSAPPMPALPHDCSWAHWPRSGLHNLRPAAAERSGRTRMSAAPGPAVVWCSALEGQGRHACESHYYLRQRRANGTHAPSPRELVRCVFQTSTRSCVGGREPNVSLFRCD